MDQIPSKAELRQKYNITEADFQFLAQPQLPAFESLQREQSYVQKLGYWGERFEVWCKRTIIGNRLIAILFIGGLTQGGEYINKSARIIYADGQQLVSYVNDFARHAQAKPVGYLVRKDIPPTDEDKRRPDPVIFNTGTGVYPATASWDRA